MWPRLLAAATLAIVASPFTGVAAATAPTPQPSPSIASLKTIASVRSTPRCASIVTHANSAISSALNNDALITQTITRLRMVNLDDGNPIHRRNGLQSLGDLAKTLTLQSRGADDEVKRLRELAAHAKDPAEAQSLKDFADELGGALWRQQTIARDLNGYLANVDFRDMTAWDEDQQNMNESVFGVKDPLAQMPDVPGSPHRPGSIQSPPTYTWTPPMPPHLGHDPYQPTATQEAQAAASDFSNRVPAIQTDEGHAAGHIGGALAGC